ncbi:MAG: HAMP domain-containing histidine kinase [Hamadaea sp.]|nr:HAMP domain-containing histidine kinase [Hamadaea sp.]
MKAFLRRHWTLRVRLTVVYGALFVVAGLAVLAITYFLMWKTLSDKRLSAQAVAIPYDAAEGANFKEKLLQKFAALEKDFDNFKGLTLRSLLTQGGAALVIVATGALGLGWMLAGRVLQPLTTITATARRVAERSLHERIRATGPHDEVRELSDTLDDMLDRLDRAFDGQRRFVGNASHELKTPLAINRTLIEVAMGRSDAPPQLIQLGQTLLEVNARHERLIDGLLTLARSEHTLATTEPVDLGDLCEHLLDPAPGLTVHRDLHPAAVLGDPVLLERLAQNLLQNATRYNHPGGALWVSTSVVDGLAVLRVANTGPVVAAYELPALFEPFRRLGADRVGSARGTGLGLSIVRSVARAHGGDVQAVPRPAADGGGLEITVALPAAPSGYAQRVDHELRVPVSGVSRPRTP